MKRLVIFILLMAFALPLFAQEDDASDYVLQVGDRIHVKIYPEDEYIRSTESVISSEGNITIPIVGKVSVAGKSVIQAEQEIRQIADRDYIVDPEVVIDVLVYKERVVTLLGEVKKPGSYQFPPGAQNLTLLQALSMAGGFTDVANEKKIKIVRQTDQRNRVIYVNVEAIVTGESPNVNLEEGDVIHVPESLF